LKALSRNTLAAALTLGAAVFTWPVQALDCAPPPYRRASGQLQDWTHLATKQIAEASTIFRGKIISAKYSGIGGNEGLPILILTYKVSEWKKGKGGSSARIAEVMWCDGGCRIQERIAEHLRDKDDQIYIAEPVEPHRGKADRIFRRMDGLWSACSFAVSIPSSFKNDSTLSKDRSRLLYLHLLAAEIEKLPSRLP